MKKPHATPHRNTLAIWCGGILLAMLLGTAIFLPIHFAVRKDSDPRVMLHPENTFEQTLHVMADMDYKPFSYYKEDGAPRGYDVELMTLLANRMGYNLNLELVHWDEVSQALRDKEVDIIMGCDWQDSVPTFEEKFVVFQEEPFKVFSDLYTKKIAVIKGCGLQDTLKKYQLWRNCVEFTTISDCVRAILTKECDCFIAHHLIGEICLREFEKQGQIHGRMDFANAQMCFGVTKDRPDLFAQLNAALLAVCADGSMDSLERKWLRRFEADIPLTDYLHNNPHILFMTINVATLIILIIGILNYSLFRIRRERNRAIAAEQAKTLFFSTVSHDIRTPLNAIIGFSELLKSNIDDKAERKQALDAITASGNTLLDLVNDILDLSKLETNKTVFNLKLTDVTKLASGVLHSFDLAVAAGKTKLVEDFTPTPFLLVDPQRIRQILFNLVGNAVKFTDEGEIRLKIAFEPGEDGGPEGKLTIAVSDTGHGISQENQRKLMQPFVQVQGPSSQKGTGLGLYICRQLATRMGGQLTIDSELGKGSTFTVTLPQVGFSYENPKEKDEGEGEAAAPDASSLRVHSVLVVDDMAVNRLVTKAMLKRLNIGSVTLTANGEEALKALRAAPDAFDLVLTDMWMPVMDGKALTGEIRKDDRLKELPVYAVTADSEAQENYAAFGFTGILLKPVTLEKLRKLLS